MFDLSKLNENLRAGSDRIGRILGKETLEKVKENAWKGLAKKDSDANQGDSKEQLRHPEGRQGSGGIQGHSSLPATNQT